MDRAVNFLDNKATIGGSWGVECKTSGAHDHTRVNFNIILNSLSNVYDTPFLLGRCAGPEIEALYTRFFPFFLKILQGPGITDEHSRSQLVAMAQAKGAKLLSLPANSTQHLQALVGRNTDATQQFTWR